MVRGGDMNIFVTSYCPIESAKFLDDKRVNKMCLESAQMLSTALRTLGCEDERLYKSTHKNHPSCVWVRQSDMNFVWLLAHFEALLDEYEKRRGREHGCSRLLAAFYANIDWLPVGELTDFANCAANSSLGLSYKHVDDVRLAYQLYLADRWETDKRAPTWYGLGR